MRQALLHIIASVVILSFSAMNGYCMNVEWSFILDIEEEARGYIDKIIENDGLYYAIFFENTANKQHVAIFDKNGLRHGEIRNSVNRSLLFVYGNDTLATEGDTVTLYSLPNFTKKATTIKGNIGDITAITMQDSPAAFCVYGFGESRTLYGVSNTGEIVWRTSVEDGPRIRGLFTANEYIVAPARIRELSTTYVLLFSLTGKLMKTIALDDARDTLTFSNIAWKTGTQVDKEHIVIIGDLPVHNSDWSRFAKVNIYTGHTELVDVPARAGGVRSLSMLPDGSLAFRSSGTLFLLDTNLKPYARFPEEQYPEIQPICTFLALPNGDFLIGSAVYDEKGRDKPWIGYVKRSVFVPCDKLY